MGDLEQMVMLALLRLGNSAYGMEVREEIERTAGRALSYGAVYTTLDRLEKKRMVAHRMGEPTGERGGRARKFFRVLPAGREALRAHQREIGLMWKGVSI